VTAAARQADYRRRRDAGRVTLRIEVDEIELAEKLRQGGYLDGHDDRGALEAALARLVADLALVTLRGGDA
jgi:hypothetical protein